MKYYLAPMEGVTNYIFRGVFCEAFGGADKYYTPFFKAHTKRSAKTKEMNEVSPGRNAGQTLIPQILTSNAEDFLQFEKDMHEAGFPEVNINLGCPSGTVFNKGRGSGMLKDTEKLDQFLYDAFAGKTGKVSVKTRLGVSDPEEFYRLMEIYNKYEMEELIIHVRVREEFYKGLPHQDKFVYALKESKNPLCYNGDIWSPADRDALLEMLKKETGKEPASIMIGRGAVADPAIFRELSGGAPPESYELSAYLEKLQKAYFESYGNDTNVLYKMKEIWSYLIRRYPEEENHYRKLLKSKTLSEFKIYEKAIINEC